MFDILYSHDDFIVINKHPNVSVHKDDGDTMLVQEVATKMNADKLFLVHRLDKMTSGILLLARSSASASVLSGLFAARTVEKYYLAIGAKKPKKKQGLVMGDMERSRRSSWKLVNSAHNPAITQFFSFAGEPGERVFLCKPHTGKTHQIRVALNSVGSSIVGDPIYSSDTGADRGYLHAFSLSFDYLNQTFRFVCDPREHAECGQKWHSQVVSDVIDSIAQPWQLAWPKLNNRDKHANN